MAEPSGGPSDKRAGEGSSRRATKSRSTSDKDPKVMKYHWSHHVQSHVGNTLYLIFLKFRNSSIKRKESVVHDIESAGILDYFTFHLYASRDLLVRVWADKQSIDLLRTKFSENRELDPEEPDIMEANEVHYFPDGPTEFLTEDEANELAQTLTVAHIDAVQSGEGYKLGEALMRHGLRLKDSVRFDSNKIQFYIIVRSIHHDPKYVSKVVETFKKFVKIHNKTVYGTKGHASEAVIKGQVSQGNFYEIYRFLDSVTDDLSLAQMNINTETILVAAEGAHGSGKIDLKRAGRHLLERAFKTITGSSEQLDTKSELMLMVRLEEAQEALEEDRNKILLGLIAAKARNDPAYFGNLRTFFSEIEAMLRTHLYKVLLQLFGQECHEAKKALLKKEGIEQTKGELVLGDLLKVYKRLVEECEIIDTAPLTGEEFRNLMQNAPKIRNNLMHSVPGLSAWDELFLFFRGFVRIESRLNNYISSL